MEDHRTLSLVEKFGVFTGIVGLVADTLALVTFFAGVWLPGDFGDPATVYGLFVGIAFLLIVYGWVTTSWVLARKGLNHVEQIDARRKLTEEIIAKSSGGIALMLLPLAIAWTALASSAGGQAPQPTATYDESSPTTVALVVEESESITPTLTLTSVAAEQQALTPTSTKPSPLSQGTVGAGGGVVVGFIFGYPLLTLIVYGALALVMPLFYSDLTPRGTKRR